MGRLYRGLAPLCPAPLPPPPQALSWMLANDITDVLDLTFTAESDFFGRKETVELVPGEQPPCGRRQPLVGRAHAPGRMRTWRNRLQAGWGRSAGGLGKVCRRARAHAPRARLCAHTTRWARLPSRHASCGAPPPGGRELRVTEANKREYVTLTARHRMTTSIRSQVWRRVWRVMK
jgi:hypothetical protein